ncbi:uncharacterized protein NMK_2446 [Novimethylophilus kurashikiensis]|uniref:Uncharacterized protein n=1 Tax=Novimethylophilus kurashikiensis TaxID=1825523 RepID=A0A2R5F9Y2_9PROT|nr:uncharacterized protein NMK_2446 [Novimethylophilus kurashikiensis]
MTSSIWLGPFELGIYERFRVSKPSPEEDAKVLRQVAAWLRPFCRVKWTND